MYKFKDLTGKRFGKLVAIEPTNKRESRYIIWRCICDCGKEYYVNSKRLQRGTIVNCGCEPKPGLMYSHDLLDLTGMVYSDLTVLKRSENKGVRTAWLCMCKCGNEVVVTTHDLRGGHTKSCGCRIHNSMIFKNLAGQRIGYLTVIDKTDKRDYKGSVLWKCHCDCGNDKVYSADILVNGNVKSCGCFRDNEICGKINETLHRVEGTCIERLNLQHARSDNKSGHVGVCKRNDNCFRAMIGFQGKRYYLGTYSTLEEAIKARERGVQIHLDFLEKYYLQCSETQEQQ